MPTGVKRNNIKNHSKESEKDKRILIISAGIQIFTIIFFVVIGSQKILDVYQSTALTILFLLIENIYTITYRLISNVSTDDLKDAIDSKSIILNHAEISTSNWLLKREYKRAFNSFSKKISDLSRGYFSIDINKIPQISIDVVEHIENCGFATVVIGKTDDLFYSDKSGQVYLEKCYEKAATLPQGFTRVFIIDNFLVVTPRVYDLMEEHVAKKVRVFIAYSKDLEKCGLNPNLDFAIWDNNCVMQVVIDPGNLNKKLNAYIHIGDENEKELLDAIDNKKKLLTIGKDWADFSKEFCKSQNQKFWNQKTQNIHKLPPPAGPSKKDAKNMCEQAFSQMPNIKNVLILGYTKHLIDEVVSFFKEKNIDIIIHVVDNGAHNPRFTHSNVSFFNKNWLTWKPETNNKYDIILGDDVLVNLSIWQYHLFFKNISDLINPKGCLILRTSAIFDSKTITPNFDTVFTELKEITNQIKNDYDIKKIVLVKTWPMFHSADFYDNKTRSFQMSKWDERIEGAIKSGHKNVEKMKLQLDLTMTSPEFGEIVDYAKNWFNHSTDDVDQYVENDTGLSNFYKIVCFVKKT